MKLKTTICIILYFTSHQSLAASLIPVKLECEHLVNPIGVDCIHPRLSWQFSSQSHGLNQAAYSLIVGTDSIQVNRNFGNCLQASRVKSTLNLVTYTGKPLLPFTKYYWKVLVWDEKGNNVKAAPIASFETGMMQVNNWQGTWISDDNLASIKPAPYFRKEFSVSKKIISARAYIAAAGLYELSINGKSVGDHRLDPMYTRYDRRNLYVTYDITANLQQGSNAIGVLLGNGWYNFQSLGVWDFERAPWRNRPTFCLDLRILYSDGTIATIISDKSWATSLSPVIYNSIYTGEQYNALLEQDGWNTANFDARKWKPVINRQAPSLNIVSQLMQPIRNVEKILPLTIDKVNDTTYIYNLGRNISGVSQIILKGEAGTVVKLIHAERLGKNGDVDQSNVDYFLQKLTRAVDPFATDIYTLNGKGDETFMPRFNYKGFQYVKVISSKPVHLTRQSLTGYFMHSDVEPIGSINSSSDLINKLYQATNASYLSNLFGYPTDCPQREKNGWTGDAHIASEVGLYNFDGITIYEKWMADHRDEQQPNGVLPSIIPTGGWGYEWGNGPDWTSTIAIIPWNTYLFYGDAKLLTDCYPNIQRYVEHINNLYPTGLTTWGLGDWAPVKSKTPVELTSSVYYYVDVVILAKAARISGKKADYEKYSALANNIKKAINAKYLNSKTGIYADGNQTEQSVPLCWGIVPDSLKAKAATHLAKIVAANNYHLDVGILGAKAILNALSENGQAETAYKLVTQTSFPSWGWWIQNGATTLYENWNINAPRDLSLNHIMFGEVGAWLYKGLGGIKPDEEKPGFKNVLLAPNFVHGLDHFEARHRGPNGEILSAWKKDGNNISYNVNIPANTTARVALPFNKGTTFTLNGKLIKKAKFYSLASGLYQFIITDYN